MASDLEREIGDAERVALNYARLEVRPKLASFFALDRRLGQIVAATNEIMLGQMRLAWWRDMLGSPIEDRPTGDAVLDAIGESWEGEENNLRSLIDAWEAFLVAEELKDDVLIEFVSGRASPMAFALVGAGNSASAESTDIGVLWALADTAAHVSDVSERAMILKLVETRSEIRKSHRRVPTAMAVLRALSLRAIARGGRPLMDGRGAALTALRAGLIGR